MQTQATNESAAALPPENLRAKAHAILLKLWIAHLGHGNPQPVRGDETGYQHCSSQVQAATLLHEAQMLILERRLPIVAWAEFNPLSRISTLHLTWGGELVAEPLRGPDSCVACGEVRREGEHTCGKPRCDAKFASGLLVFGGEL